MDIGKYIRDLRRAVNDPESYWPINAADSLAAAGTGAATLVDTWSSDGDGFAASFENTPSIYVKDSGTPANDKNLTTASLTDFSTFFTYTSPSVKITRQSDGDWKYQAHNRLTRSDDLENTDWVRVDSDVSGETISITTAGTSKGIYQNATVVSGATYKFITWVKSNSVDTFNVQYTGGGRGAYFDLTNNLTSFYGAASVSSSIEDDGDYKKCTYVYVAVSTTSTARHYICPTDNYENLTASIGASVDVQKTQLLTSPAVETYVQTTSVPVYALPIHYNADASAYGLHVEPAATNLLADEYNRTATPLFSLDGSATSARTATGVTGVANSAWTHTTTGSSSDTIAHGITTISSDTFYITSIVYKRVSGDNWVVLESRFVTVASGIIYTWFDLANGVKGTSSVTPGTTTAALDSYDLEDLGDGFYRIWMKVKTTTGTQMTSRVSSASADGSLTGSGGSYINEMWQLELATNLPKPTSPIRTYGSTATRAIDNITKATSALPYDTSTGTWYAKAEVITNNANTSLLEFSDGNLNTDRFYMACGSARTLYMLNGGAVQADLSPTVSLGADNKRASAWAANDAAAGADGGAVSTDNSVTVTSGIDTLCLGIGRAGASNGGHCYIKEFMYLPERLSNANIVILTT